MIEAASSAGTNIIILSKNSNYSDLFKNEVRAAFNLDSMIFPVYIDDVELEGELRFRLLNMQGIFPPEPIKDENDLDNFVDMVVNEVRHTLNRYFKKNRENNH